MDLTTLKSRIRSLVDDPDATYATDAFLLPLINQKYEELYNRMLSTGAEFERKVVELFNVPAQTQDLSAYGLSSQPLELLVEPLNLDWKLAGLDNTNYTTATLVDKVRDVIPNQSIDDWEWRAGIIYFTPCTANVDIRVRGDFLPAVLADDKDQVLSTVKHFSNALAYGAAALVGLVRGNQGWTQSYTMLQDNAVDDVMQYLARKDQQKLRRIAPMTRRRFRTSVVK